MAPINGKYQQVRDENYVEFLTASGVPEDQAKQAAAAPSVLEFAVDGSKVVLTRNNGKDTFTSDLVIGQESQENIGTNVVAQSTAAVSGDTVTITSKYGNGSVGTRVYTFFDSELVLTTTSGTHSVTAKRYYKRV